ncbi:hypothetical protein GALMADRAFT_133886 [Galerina marginata CBS 339.88]|uniref:Uncharacterized protein n=1 Tax=Galerina marginata (strain CBS 339.88) TaxID=685588 RepID=A0A067TN39_GALM3|nr:hypothetical protein GALMADRAFT_133886 [Galerina marginata CBS 339.88]
MCKPPINLYEDDNQSVSTSLTRTRMEWLECGGGRHAGDPALKYEYSALPARFLVWPATSNRGDRPQQPSFLVKKTESCDFWRDFKHDDNPRYLQLFIQVQRPPTQLSRDPTGQGRLSSSSSLVYSPSSVEVLLQGHFGWFKHDFDTSTRLSTIHGIWKIDDQAPSSMSCSASTHQL